MCRICFSFSLTHILPLSHLVNKEKGKANRELRKGERGERKESFKATEKVVPTSIYSLSPVDVLGKSKVPRAAPSVKVSKSAGVKALPCLVPAC